jgi:hypothetical protein
VEGANSSVGHLEPHLEYADLRQPQPASPVKPISDNTQDLMEFINTIVLANEMKYPESFKTIDMVEQIQEKVKVNCGNDV